jgi:uncharacterized protein DUF1707
VRQYVSVDEPRPEPRIGDRERRAVDAHLQQAHADGVLTLTEYDERAAQCWAARTQSELDVLVLDLPPYRPDPDAEAPTVAVPAGSADAPPAKGLGQRFVGGAVGVAIAGAALLFGSQVLTADDGIAVMGSREVTVAPGQDRVEVGMAFGSVRVLVPADARARTTGMVVFGSTECELACTGPGREVVVNVTGAFGSVNVVRPGEADDEDEDEDED